MSFLILVLLAVPFVFLYKLFAQSHLLIMIKSQLTQNTLQGNIENHNFSNSVLRLSEGRT